MNAILIIIAVGIGNGTGVGMVQIPYSSQENCQAAAKTLMDHKYQNIYGSIEALCINGDKNSH